MMNDKSKYILLCYEQVRKRDLGPIHLNSSSIQKKIKMY